MSEIRQDESPRHKTEAQCRAADSRVDALAAQVRALTEERDSFKLGMAMANQGWQECQVERDRYRAALETIPRGAKRYWREGDDAYQLAILADAALASAAAPPADRGGEHEWRCFTSRPKEIAHLSGPASTDFLLLFVRLGRRRWLAWSDPFQQAVERIWRFIRAKFSRRLFEFGGLLRCRHFAFHWPEFKRIATRRKGSPTRGNLARFLTRCRLRSNFPRDGICNDKEIYFASVDSWSECGFRSGHPARATHPRQLQCCGKQQHSNVQLGTPRILGDIGPRAFSQDAGQKEDRGFEYYWWQQGSIRRQPSAKVFEGTWLCRRAQHKWYAVNAARRTIRSAGQWQPVRVNRSSLRALATHGLIPTVTFSWSGSFAR